MKVTPALTYAPKDTRRDAAKRKRARRRRLPDYLAWLHTQPCLVPLCPRPVNVHHERTLGQGDAFGVPLCPYHHQTGPQARHVLRSLLRFEAAFGISVRAEIARLKAEYEAEA